jgi:hypothetical protein
MNRLHLLLSSTICFAAAACAADSTGTDNSPVEVSIPSSSNAASASAATAPAELSEGDIEVTTVAGDDCVPTTATASLFLGSEGAAKLGAPGAVASVDGKIVVAGERGTGFVTAGSSDPISVAEGDDHFLPGASDIGVVSSGDDVQYSRFSIGGVPLGNVTVAKERAYTAAGMRAGDAAILTWATYDAVRTAAVVAGVPSTPVDLETNTPKDSFAAALTTASTGAFMLWSDRRVADSEYRVYSAWPTTTGISGLPRVLFGGPTPRRIVSVVPAGAGSGATSPNGGFVALFAWGEPSRPMIVHFDANGRPIGTGIVFEGARTPLGLAVQGDTVGLLARRDDGSVVFRGTGSWVCLAGSGADFPGGAVMAEGDGFAVAHGDDDGSVSYVHLGLDGN